VYSSIFQIGFKATYNFIDFVPQPANMNVFDTSICYPEANKVTFQIRFPGELVLYYLITTLSSFTYDLYF